MRCLNRWHTYAAPFFSFPYLGSPSLFFIYTPFPCSRLRLRRAVVLVNIQVNYGYVPFGAAFQLGTSQPTISSGSGFSRFSY